MKAKDAKGTLSEPCENEFWRLSQARHHEPHAILGWQVWKGKSAYKMYRPEAESVWITIKGQRIEMEREAENDFFYWQGDSSVAGLHPSFIEKRLGDEQVFLDAYSFSPDTDAAWLNDFHHQECFTAYRYMGAHVGQRDGVSGVRFLVWAPNAERVSVVGDFNGWDGRFHPMSSRGATGIWELFIPQLKSEVLYKFEIRHRTTGCIAVKADPYGRMYEMRPDTASVITTEADVEWHDELWMQKRARSDFQKLPLSIYEIHLGSWRRDEQGGFLSYIELAHQVVPYVKEMGFTHIELLPITEFPYDGSWGYQVTGYFAPTRRFGDVHAFKYFVDYCHRHNVGVILDWVPAHFPKDAHGLAEFDGSCLYEHENPLRGEHKDWGTLIFNYGRNEVRNFLFSSAYFWLEECHIDGIRVDAVASMLYLDYSREPGEWEPNVYGGNENLDAIHFVQRLNERIHKDFPGIMVIAEESTSWPQVSRPVYLGGLGFTLKWNMGWMNDTLHYLSLDPIHRQYHHENLTFSLLYAFSENFLLPLSHDEVVHGKRSLLEKMPGDDWQKFAQLRLLYCYLFTHPGKKLMFMGGEFAQGREWCYDRSLDWEVLAYPWQQGVQLLVKDLNRLYVNSAELYEKEFNNEGFEWIDCHDNAQSVISYRRNSSDGYLIVVLNFTPIVRQGYRVGVPDLGCYGEILNSDSCFYGGSDVSNGEHIMSQPIPTLNMPYSLELNLPPLGAIILARKFEVQ